MFKNHSKLSQKSSKNRLTLVQKSIKICSKINQNRSQGPLGELWRPSWPQEQKKCVRPPFVPPLLGAKLEPKIGQNRSQERSKMWSFFYSYWDRFLERLVGKLGPTWEPKPTQNSPKLGPKSNQNPFKILSCFWHPYGPIFDGFWLQLEMPEPSKIELSPRRRAHFGCLLVGWLLEANLARFWGGFGTQVEAKIHQKSVQEGIKNKIKFWMDFGRLLDRFLVDFGAKLGAKLEPSWTKNL